MSPASRGEAHSQWRTVIGALVVSRLVWLGVFVAVLLIDFPGTPIVDGLRSHLVSWDATAYISIASHGYSTTVEYHDAFLPGFPLLVRAVAALTADAVSAAWLVNAAAETLALWYVARLIGAERDKAAAVFAVWMLALAPAALFLIAPFTESPFIAAAAASLFYARAGRPRDAAIAAAAACALRLTGLALIPALAIEQLRRTGWRPRSQLLVLVAVPLPIVAYCAYMWLHTGHPLALLEAEHSPSFGESPAAPWDGLVATWNTMITASDGETRSIFAREVAFGLLGLLLCAGMWASSRIPRSLALYCSIAWLMTASLPFWRSQARYSLALFPALLLVSDLTQRARRARPAMIVASGLLMFAGTWIYAQGRWLG